MARNFFGPALLAGVAAIILLAAAPAPAQGPAGKPSAADLFEQTLETEGLAAAVARLSEALADTTEPYAIDPFELGIGLPNRLVLRHRRQEALELVKTLEILFGDDPRYLVELGKAHLRCGEAPQARAALTSARDLMNNRPDLAWMVEHLDDLAAVAQRQAAMEDALVPGAATGLTGPYLGQSPPGKTPEVFAAGILSTTAHEYHLSFSPEGSEIYFSRGGVGTLVTRWQSGGWTVPEPVYFIDPDHLTEEANLTPDGRSVIFCGRGDVRGDRALYRSYRTADGWSAPDSLFPGMYGTATLDGTLYYTARGEGRDYGAVVRRRWSPQGYSEPEVVPGEGINSEFPDAHPWVAPDGGLLLFDTYRDPGAGIYASFRQAEGGWKPAVPLGERLGIPPVGQCALSHDGKYLFFCLAGDMYWVDAGFLDELSQR